MSAAWAWCGSSAMPAMEMPGGWTLSAAWLRLPGQGWPEVAGSFVASWTAMMAVMMLPALAATVWRYRRAVGDALPARHLLRLAGTVAAAYLLVWAAAGALVFPVGAALGELALRSPVFAHTVPVASAALLMAAGALQLSRWKVHHLACCRQAPRPLRSLRADTRTAWRYGRTVALHCLCACSGLTLALLVTGFMELAAMAAVTCAVALERLAPAGQAIARGTGALLLGWGMSQLVASAL